MHINKIVHHTVQLTQCLWGNLISLYPGAITPVNTFSPFLLLSFPCLPFLFLSLILTSFIHYVSERYTRQVHNIYYSILT